MNIEDTVVTLYDKQEVDIVADHTALNAVEVCPRWGGIRYGAGLNVEGTGRSLALEAGKVCHEFFSAVRFIELVHQFPKDEHFLQVQGARLFTEERFQDCLPSKDLLELTDLVEGLNFGINILESSGYYDDPRDKRRTMANIQEACTAYYNDWSFTRWPVFVADGDDPQRFVGIELTTDLYIEYEDLRVRYTGRMDGIHMHTYKYDGETLTAPVVHENKTSGRLDEAWKISHLLAHQCTGYAVAGSLMVGTLVPRAMILGLQLPQPRNTYNPGQMQFPSRITDKRINEWLEWVHRNGRLMMSAISDPLGCETRRHSCSRYFQPCAFFALCGEEDRQTQQEMLGEFITDRWDPLAEVE